MFRLFETWVLTALEEERMRKFILTLGLAILTAAPAVAQTTVIDIFNLPTQGVGGTDYLTVNSGSDFFVQSGVDAIGGTRVYYGQKFNGNNPVQLGLNNTQSFRFVENPVSQGRAKLLYGYSAVNVTSLDSNDYLTGHTLSRLNANVSTANGVFLDYASGGTATITVTLISGSEGAAQQASVTLPAPVGLTTLFFPKAAFTANNPSLNLSDVDEVIVSLDGLPTSLTTSLDNIMFATVPEPTVIAMGGIGFVGVGGVVARTVQLRRRRRRLAKLAKMARTAKKS